MGRNPFPILEGRNATVVEDALTMAKDVSAREDCDTALKEFGIESLNSLVKQYTVNSNIYDGRQSTVGYPAPKKGKKRTSIMKRFNDNRGIGAEVVDKLFTGKTGNVTFLSHYFFDPQGGFAEQQRAVILLHEAVHHFTGRNDQDSGGSRALSLKIAEKCFPALKPRGNLGEVTL